MLKCGDEPQVSLFDEIEKFDAAIPVAPRDRHDQPEIREDERLARVLIAPPHRGPELLLVLALEERIALDLGEVPPLDVADGVIGGGRGFPVRRGGVGKVHAALAGLGEKRVEGGRVEIRSVHERLDLLGLERPSLQTAAHRLAQLRKEPVSILSHAPLKSARS